MPFQSLGEFIGALREAGELQTIGAAVSPELEISEIYNRVVKKKGPALLFERVEGSAMPLLINAFGSSRRMALALGAENLQAVQQEIRTFLQCELPKDNAPPSRDICRLASLDALHPRLTDTPPCQEVVLEKNFSLYELPALKSWPGDGGRFITMPCVFTRNPETGRRNAGVYRMQLTSPKSCAVHWLLHKHGAANFRNYQKNGRRMEMAAVIGPDPTVSLAAFAPLPEGFDELYFSGFLRKEPVPMVKCRTIDMEVPASAEIVLEGYIDPRETVLEGPFGDRSGYYSQIGQFPKFNVTCITHRKNPVYQTTVVGPPPMEDFYIADALLRILLPVIQWSLPEIEDMFLPAEGAFNNLLIVSLKKTFPWQARKIMHAIWGMGQLMFTKAIVVVDAGIDVRDISQVLWQVSNNIDPKWDVTFTEGPVEILDHASRERHLGTKMGIDATSKLPEEGCKHRWPAPTVMSEDIQKKVEARWEEYGIEI